MSARLKILDPAAPGLGLFMTYYFLRRGGGRKWGFNLGTIWLSGEKNLPSALKQDHAAIKFIGHNAGKGVGRKESKKEPWAEFRRV